MMHPKPFFFLLLFTFTISMGLVSCGMFKKKNLSQQGGQVTGETPISANRRYREKMLKANRKRYISMQTRDTQRRIRANRRQSDRINRNLPERRKKGVLGKVFKRTGWWR
jgi:hypothetical protein